MVLLTRFLKSCSLVFWPELLFRLPVTNAFIACCSLSPPLLNTVILGALALPLTLTPTCTPCTSFTASTFSSGFITSPLNRTCAKFRVKLWPNTSTFERRDTCTTPSAFMVPWPRWVICSAPANGKRAPKPWKLTRSPRSTPTSALIFQGWVTFSTSSIWPIKRLSITLTSGDLLTTLPVVSGGRMVARGTSITPTIFT